MTPIHSSLYLNIGDDDEDEVSDTCILAIALSNDLVENLFSCDWPKVYGQSSAHCQSINFWSNLVNWSSPHTTRC